MPLRDRLRRLQKVALDKLACFELVDGGRYWFDPNGAFTEVFRHTAGSLRADFKGKSRPDPPEILKAIARAKDRQAALEKLYPAGGCTPFCAFDLEVLLERGELVPRSLVIGREVGERLEDLSEDPHN